MTELYASGVDWVGSGVRSIESGLETIFGGARRRIVACCYSVSEEFDLAPAWIEDALDRGVEVVLVVNRIAGQDRWAMSRLDALARAYAHFQFWDYSGPHLHDLHAKVFIRDEEFALIGSSNLSRNGLLRNHELAVGIEGDGARKAADLVIALTRSASAERRH